MTDAIESQRDAFILWQRVQEAENEAHATGAEREKWKARAAPSALKAKGPGG
jgi:hypothetical protein